MDTIINQMFEITIKKIFEFCVNTIQSLIDLLTDLSDTLFQSAYVQGLLSFFQYFGYCLFIIACIIGIFEMVIQYQNGDGSAARSLFMNFIKGLMAALLFTTLPVLLFQFVLELQKYITVALTGSMDLDGQMLNAIEQIGIILNGGELPPGSETGAAGVTIPAGQMAITLLIVVILLVYVSIKVVFGNIKRGGILLIITCIGSFHMVNVPRGYFDAFFGWCKQVIALCFTAFFQNILYVLGILLMADTAYLPGFALLLAAAEVPRIAQQFGLDTSAKGNIMGAVHTVSTVKHIFTKVR